tara:strand:+ start:933 stop:1442 length:510 start_codon:yes stop_codon:yes gene_type:complete
MYDLNDKEYYSKAEDKFIPISHMDFQHLIRAFVKFCSEDQDLTIARCDTQAKTIADYIDKVEQLEDIIDEKDKTIDKLSKEEQRWRKAYANDCYTQGWRYVFSEIPNDTDGQEFVDTMKKYLNKESYKMRVKGQHLKPELYGQNRAYHGVNLGDSTHMRVYIDVKKGDE